MDLVSTRPEIFKFSKQKTAKSFKNFKKIFYTFLISLSFLLLFQTDQVRAADINWNGGNGDFNTNTNWSSSTVPGSGDHAHIDNGQAGTTSDVTMSGSATLDALTIDSDDSLDLATNGVDLTMQNAGASTGVITNNGELILSGTSSETAIFISGGDLTINGTGSVTLNNSGGDQMNRIRINAAEAGHSLIVGSGQTIQGSGLIGFNEIGINNSGLITANQTNELDIDPSASGVTNTGTLSAQGGNVLNLLNGTFTNTGGLIQVSDTGSQVKLSGANINGGSLTTASDNQITVTGGSTLTDVTLTSGSILKANAGVITSVSGTITNNGNIHLNGSGGTNSTLQASGDVTFTGSGTVFLNDDNDDFVNAALNTYRITNDVNHTFEGYGVFGNDLAKVTNKGLITANVSGQTLFVNPSDDGTDHFINEGTLKAENGGTLELNDGIYDQSAGASDGLILADGSGSRIRLDTTLTVKGGTLQTANSGEVWVDGGQSTFDGTNVGGLQLTGTFRNTADGADAILKGDVTHDGTWTLEGAGIDTEIIIDNGGADFTLQGTGTISLQDSGADLRNGIVGTTNEKLILPSTRLIQGSGHIGSDTLSFQNDGTITANLSNELVINPDVNGFDNNNLLQATSGSILRLTDGTFDNTGGTIQAVNDNSQVRLNGVTVSNGSLTSSGVNAKFRAISATTLQNVTLTNGTEFHVDNSVTTTAEGTLTNNGSIYIDGSSNTYLKANGNLLINGNGTIFLDQENRDFIMATNTLIDVITNGATHTIEGYGRLGNNSGKFVNNGLIDGNSSGNTLYIYPTTAADGFVNNSTLQASNSGIVRLQSSTYTNNGTIQAVDSGSRINIGGSTISGGTLHADAGASIHMDGNGTLNDVTIDSGTDYIVNKGFVNTLKGTLTNNGSISLLDGAGTDSFLTADGDITITGTGSIILNDVNDNYINTNLNTERITQEANHTIMGYGVFGNDIAKITNKGLLTANVSGQTLFLNPSDDGTDHFINEGILKAENGGTLELNDGTFDQVAGASNGLIQADGPGSRIRMDTTLTVRGGTIQTINSGEVWNDGGVTTYDGTNVGGIQLTGTFRNTADGADATLKGDVTHDGTWTLEGVNSDTEIIIDNGGSDFTLQGNGTISLQNSGADIRNGIVGTANEKLILPNTRLIQGSGRLGSNTLSFQNDGTITANLGNELVIDPDANGFDNNNLLQATSGALLRLASGSFDNTGGTIQAVDASSEVRLNGATVSNGTLTTSGANAYIRAISGSTLNNVTLSTGSTFLVNQTVTATLEGTITNNGTMDIVNGTSNTTFQTNGDVTLTGNGKLVLFQENRDIVTGSVNTDRLTNESNHTISGYGRLGNGGLKITNKGTITADQNSANELFVNTTNAADGLYNEGTIRSENGGQLRFQSTTIDQTTGGTPGLIESDGAGSVTRLEGVTVIGGTIQTVNGGQVRHSGATTYDGSGVGGITLSGDVKTNTNGADVTLKGTITNNANITLNGTSSPTEILGDGDVTLNGTGTLTLGDSGGDLMNRISSLTSGRITFGANQVVQGSGRMGDTRATSFTNNGLVDANNNDSGTLRNLILEPQVGGDFTNNGTLQVSGSGNLVLNAGGSYVNNGLLRATDGQTFTINRDFSGSTGSLEADNGTLSIGAVTVGDAGNTGSITIKNGGALTLAGSTVHGGDLSLTGANSSLSVASSITLTGDLTFDITDETDWSWGASSPLNMNGGTSVNNGVNEYNFDNYASLEIGGQDFGTDPVNHTGDAAGFTNNFDLTELVIGPNGHVKLVDQFDNGNRIDNGYGTNESIYVDTLTFSDADSRLLTNGFHIYYNTLSALPGGNPLSDFLLANNTVTANNQSPGNPVELGSNVLVDFNQVTADGNTFANAISDQAIIDDFLGDELVYQLIEDSVFDIDSSATFDVVDGFIVRIPYDQASFDAFIAPTGMTEDQLRLFHRSGPGLIDDITATVEQLARLGILSPVDTVNNYVYGFSTSFSEFGVGVNPEPSTILMLLLSFGGLAFRRFKK